jgi:hypothetical protein
MHSFTETWHISWICVGCIEVTSQALQIQEPNCKSYHSRIGKTSMNSVGKERNRTEKRKLTDIWCADMLHSVQWDSDSSQHGCIQLFKQF